MNRLGLEMGQLDEVKSITQKLAIKWRFIMSHLACDELPDHPTTLGQLSKFSSIVSRFPGQNFSLVASGGISIGKGIHHQLVRPGIGIYGQYPLFLEGKSLNLRPAVSIHARLLQTRKVARGETVGYGATQSLPMGGG